MSNVKFETIESKEIRFGRNNFLEIARKKAVSEDGENEFISISRGYYNQNNEKRYKTNLAIPSDEEFLEEFVGALKSI